MNLCTRFILFFVLFHFACRAEWRFYAAKDAATLLIDIPESFTLSNLSHESDVSFSKKELEYLTELKVADKIDAHDLERAIGYLFQRNLFDDITLSLQDEPAGKRVHFKLHGLWRFEKMKVSGVWVGKEWYKQHYLLQPGDRFDREKHYHSMTKIKQVCVQDGYFNVSTESFFSYNRKTKGVTVHAEINRDKRFMIRKNEVIVHVDKKVSHAEKMLLEKKLSKKISRALSHTKYSKKSIEYQARQLKQDLAQKGFLHVSIDLQEALFRERHNVQLTWRINVRKKRELVFFGNRFFSSAQLLEQILQFGRSAWIVPSSILSSEVQQAYHKKGFWDVQIDAKDEDSRSFFTIKEGRRAFIKQVHLEGVCSFTERSLIKKFFSKIKRHGLFDQKSIDHAFELLVDYYLKRGFLDMKILGHRYISLPKGGHQLIITLHEGERKVIEGVEVSNYMELSTQGPLSYIAKAKNMCAYNDAIVQEHTRWLAEHFRKKGFVFPIIKHELVFKEGRSVLVWSIDPGKKIVFGKTIITGATDFLFEKLVRELHYKAGDIWDHEKIKRSFIRLKNLKLFDTISFTPLPIDLESYTRNILVKLHKDDPFELRIRGGFEFQHIRQYQTFAGVAYKVGGTFMVKNPTNSGDHFRFDADVARSHREVRLKYEYPWIFGTPLDGVTQAYATKYEQPGFIGSKRNLYTFYQHGFLTGVRHKNKYIDAGINVGFEVMKTTFSDDDLQTTTAAIRLAQAINFDVRLLDRNVPYLFFEPTIMVDFLDNNLYPTKGMFSLLSFKGMFPTKRQFSNSYFIKMLVEHSWFIPLQQIVAAFRFRFGHIFHRQFSDIMPSERFYLGGSNSVRSYETDLAPPTSIFIDDDGKKHVVPRGGKTMLNVNVELRIPVASKVGIVLFQDLGLLCGDSFADFNAGRLVAGTGFGMRYHTPIGPLRFDIGWKWRKERLGERGFNWALTFGQAF